MLADVQISLLLLVALATIAMFWWKPKPTSYVVATFWIATIVAHGGSANAVDAIGAGILFALLAAIITQVFESSDSQKTDSQKDDVQKAKAAQRKLMQSAPKAYSNNGSKFRKGDKVRINGGNLDGQEGIVSIDEIIDGQIVILLEHSGKQIDASVPVANCQLVRIAP